MVLGADAAAGLGKKPGDRITLFGQKFKVLAVLQATGTVDDDRVFAHLHRVQDLAGTGQVVSAIEVLGCCEDAAGALVPQLGELLPGCRVTTIAQVVQTQVGVNRLMAGASWCVLVVLVLLGGASVLGTISSNVHHRRKEIGTLMALGAPPQLVSQLFLMKALWLGLAGGLGGSLLGVAVAVWLGPLWAGVEIRPLVNLAALAAGGALFVTLLAAYVPARARRGSILVFASGRYKPMIRLHDVTKSYPRRDQSVVAVRQASLEIAAGEYVALVGPSGSGKTTLLSLVGGMLSPDAGEVWLDGTSLYKASVTERARLRREKIGFVFQTFNLVPYLTALENVQVPLFLAGFSRHDQRERAAALLQRVGLSDRLTHLPSELSIGQQQRVALARTLANSPPVILADEPTGNLDPESRQRVLDFLAELHDQGHTVVVVTHDELAARQAQRKLLLRDGTIESQTDEAARAA